MSSANHTPGPWRVGRAGPNKCPTVGTVGGLMVAMVAYGEQHPTEANARLIAAAPELLEALMAQLVANSAVTQDSADKLSEAAIARATGAA